MIRTAALLLCLTLALSIPSTSAHAGDGAVAPIRAILEAEGEAYRAGRHRLFVDDYDTEDALDLLAAEGRKPEIRWLAQSIIAIRKDPEGADRLLKEYVAALSRLWENPREASMHVRMCGISAFSGVPLLFAHEPVIEELDHPDPSVVEQRTGWVRSLRLRESPLWPAVLAEVLLKGWLEEPEPRMLRPGDRIVSALGEPLGSKADAIDLYRFHAFLKLADAGERRGFPLAQKWLTAKPLLAKQRAKLAEVLAHRWHKSALSEIVSLAGKTSLHWRVRRDLMRLLPLVGSESAYRTLKAVSESKPPNHTEEYVTHAAAIALDRAKRVKGAKAVDVDGRRVHVLATLDVSKWRAFPGQEKTTTFVLPIEREHMGNNLRLTFRLAPPLEDGRLFRIEGWNTPRNQAVYGMDLTKAEFPDPIKPRTVVLPLGTATEVRLRWEGRCVFMCQKAEIAVAW